MRSGHFLQNYYTTGPATGNASKLVQRYKSGRDYRVPSLNSFLDCAFFFEFFCVQNVFQYNKFFDILQQTEVSKSLWHHETFKFLIFCFFFEIFLMSPNGPPFNCFDVLQQTGFSKSPKGPLVYNSNNFALFEP